MTVITTMISIKRLSMLGVLLLGLMTTAGCNANRAHAMSGKEAHDRQVRALLEEVRQIGQSIPDTQMRASMLPSMARLQAQAGWLDEAISTLKEASAGENASSMTDHESLHAYAYVAASLVKVGRDDEGHAIYGDLLEKISHLEDENQRSWRKLEIVRSYIEADLIEKAIALTWDIERPYTRVNGLLVIAKQLHEQDKQAQANTLAAEALGVAHDIAAPRDNSLALTEVLCHQAEVGDIDAAMKLLPNIKEVWETGRALAAIAQAKAKAGQIEEALTLADTIQTSDKSSALSNIAQVLAVSGQIDLAKDVYKKAIRAANPDNPRYNGSDHVMGSIAESQMAAGLLDDAMITIESMKAPLAKTMYMQRLASMLTRNGRTDEAIALADQSSDPYHKALILSFVIMAQVEQGQIEAAQPVVDQAVAYARNVVDPKDKAIALFRILVGMTTPVKTEASGVSTRG